MSKLLGSYVADGFRAAAFVVVLCRPAIADPVNVLARGTGSLSAPVAIEVSLGIQSAAPIDPVAQLECLERATVTRPSDADADVTWEVAGIPWPWLWPQLPLALSIQCTDPEDGESAGPMRRPGPGAGGGGIGGGGGGAAAIALRADGSTGLTAQEVFSSSPDPFFPDLFFPDPELADSSVDGAVGTSQSFPSPSLLQDVLGNHPFGPPDPFKGSDGPGEGGPGLPPPPADLTNSALTPVPEPATMLLTAAGLAAGWRMRRRKDLSR